MIWTIYFVYLTITDVNWERIIYNKVRYLTKACESKEHRSLLSSFLKGISNSIVSVKTDCDCSDFARNDLPFGSKLGHHR